MTHKTTETPIQSNSLKINQIPAAPVVLSETENTSHTQIRTPLVQEKPTGSNLEITTVKNCGELRQEIRVLNFLYQRIFINGWILSGY